MTSQQFSWRAVFPHRSVMCGLCRADDDHIHPLSAHRHTKFCDVISVPVLTWLTEIPIQQHIPAKFCNNLYLLHIDDCKYQVPFERFCFNKIIGSTQSCHDSQFPPRKVSQFFDFPNGVVQIYPLKRSFVVAKNCMPKFIDVSLKIFSWKKAHPLSIIFGTTMIVSENITMFLNNLMSHVSFPVH